MRAFRLTRLATVSVLGAIALLVNSVIAIQALRGVREAHQAADQTHNVRLHIEKLQTVITDAETGQRGYLITGNPEYLRPYHGARAKAGELMTELRRETAASPYLVQDLARLQPLMDAKFEELEQTIALAREQGPAAASRVVNTHLGKSYMDQIRSVIRDMDSSAQNDAARSIAVSETNFRESLIAVIAANLFVLLMVAYVEVGHIRRRRLQSFLELSEERYRVAFQENPMPMWVFDTKTLKFLSVNDSAIRQYGYSKDEFLAMTIKDIRPAEEMPRLVALRESRSQRRDG